MKLCQATAGETPRMPAITASSACAPRAQPGVRGPLAQQTLAERERPHYQRDAGDRGYVIPEAGRRHCLAPAQPEYREQEGREEDLDADDEHSRRDDGQAFIGERAEPVD